MGFTRRKIELLNLGQEYSFKFLSEHFGIPEPQHTKDKKDFLGKLSRLCDCHTVNGRKVVIDALKEKGIHAQKQKPPKIGSGFTPIPFNRCIRWYKEGLRGCISREDLFKYIFGMAESRLLDISGTPYSSYDNKLREKFGRHLRNKLHTKFMMALNTAYGGYGNIKEEHVYCNRDGSPTELTDAMIGKIQKAIIRTENPRSYYSYASYYKGLQIIKNITGADRIGISYRFGDADSDVSIHGNAAMSWEIRSSIDQSVYAYIYRTFVSSSRRGEVTAARELARAWCLDKYGILYNEPKASYKRKEPSKRTYRYHASKIFAESGKRLYASKCMEIKINRLTGSYGTDGIGSVLLGYKEMSRAVYGFTIEELGSIRHRNPDKYDKQDLMFMSFLHRAIETTAVRKLYSFAHSRAKAGKATAKYIVAEDNTGEIRLATKGEEEAIGRAGGKTGIQDYLKFLNAALLPYGCTYVRKVYVFQPDAEAKDSPYTEEEIRYCLERDLFIGIIKQMSNISKQPVDRWIYLLSDWSVDKFGRDYLGTIKISDYMEPQAIGKTGIPNSSNSRDY